MSLVARRPSPQPSPRHGGEREGPTKWEGEGLSTAVAERGAGLI